MRRFLICTVLLLVPTLAMADDPPLINTVERGRILETCKAEHSGEPNMIRYCRDTEIAAHMTLKALTPVATAQSDRLREAAVRCTQSGPPSMQLYCLREALADEFSLRGWVEACAAGRCPDGMVRLLERCTAEHGNDLSLALYCIGDDASAMISLE